MKNKYQLSKEQKMYFSSILILDLMINTDQEFPVLLFDDLTLLEPILVHMASCSYVDVTAKGYIPAKKGRDMFDNFMDKITEFRSIYKIYSAVDLGAGEFGYEKYFDFDTDEEFMDYICEKRFEDLRVAVCEFKGINVLDMVFMELLSSGKINTSEFGWEANITTDLIWDELVAIANDNICLDDLIETDDKGVITYTGQEIIQMILKEGTELSQKLAKKQAEIEEEEESNNRNNDDSSEYEEVIIEEIYEPMYYPYDFYDVYYDPYYVSPLWGPIWY